MQGILYGTEAARLRYLRALGLVGVTLEAILNKGTINSCLSAN
jgi:hypothetical protein